MDTIHHKTIADLKRGCKLSPIQPSHLHSRNLQHSNESLDSRTYYWIWAEENGRRILWGPYTTNEEAQRRGYSKLHCYFEVVALRTKDESTASRLMRARMLNDTGNIGESFQRFGHKENE